MTSQLPKLNYVMGYQLRIIIHSCEYLRFKVNPIMHLTGGRRIYIFFSLCTFLRSSMGVCVFKRNHFPINEFLALP